MTLRVSRHDRARKLVGKPAHMEWLVLVSKPVRDIGNSGWSIMLKTGGKETQAALARSSAWESNELPGQLPKGD